MNLEVKIETIIKVLTFIKEFVLIQIMQADVKFLKERSESFLNSFLLSKITFLGLG